MVGSWVVAVVRPAFEELKNLPPRGRCRRMSAEEGMRGELMVEEPTKTAENLAFYASSVSTSAATFPMGEGLDRRYLNDTTIATVLEWLRKSFNLFGHRSTQRQGDKRQRRSRLNRVKCTVARRFAQSTSGILQNITPGIQGAAAP